MKKVFTHILNMSFLSLALLTSCGQTTVEENYPETEAATETVTEAVTEMEETAEPMQELPEIRVFLVGGSIVNANPYDNGYYVEFGYGSLLSMYMNEKAVIYNMGSKGLSVKSYGKNDLYAELK